MMSMDMFADTQQTPVGIKALNTPSMTPTRSVKRRSYVNRSNTPTMAVPKRGAVSCFSKSQPCHHEDFYDLRTRLVPLCNNENDIWATYGINDRVEIPRNKIVNHPSSTMTDKLTADSLLINEKGAELNRKWLFIYVSGICILMFLSAILGALCYAQMQHYFHTTGSCSPLQISQHTESDRSTISNVQSHQLENSVLRLEEKLKLIQDHLSNLQENVGSEVDSSPQNGILEELLTADLVSSGNLGSVLATPDTKTVTIPATVTLLWVFSFPIHINHRHPHTTIEGLIQEVGDCWPFEGSKGRLILKLHRHSLVTGVSISHIPPSISVSGDVSSAPRFFQVLAHQNEEDFGNGQILGEYEYKSVGTWRQTFPLELNTEKNLFKIIEFRFLKNYGNPNYTCVYRVHVHGKQLE